ncbi:unnamed protein product [Rhizopus stolonifer]
MPPKQNRQQSLLTYFKKKTKAEKRAEQDSLSKNSQRETPQDKEDVIICIEEDEEDEGVSEEREEEEEEEEDIDVHHRKRRIRITIDEDSSDEEDRNAKAQRLDHHSDETDDDELSFLDKSDILKERTRGKRESNYTKDLEKLKDRKSKLNSYNTNERGPIERYLGSSGEDDSDEDSLQEDFNEESDFVVDDDTIDGVKMTNRNMDKQGEEVVDIPAEFSRNRALSWSKQFKIYIEYLVAQSLATNFEPTNRFILAKNAVVRRVQSYKDSMVTSDVWLAGFKESMDLYPNWVPQGRINTLSEVFCKACRSNKPATLTLKLCSDEDDPGVTFSLGRECYRKGELYHRFTHFETHIYDKVKSEVEIVINKMPKNKLITHEDIYDQLVESNFVHTLSRSIKTAFLTTTSVYNLKGERYIIEDTSSSDDDDM